MTVGEEVDFFLWKINRRFNVDAQADQLLGQVMHTQRKGTLQRAQSIARRLCRTGLDQVSNGFGLGQVKLVVEECPLTEFTWTCQAAAQLQAALQQHIQYDRTAVAL